MRQQCCRGCSAALQGAAKVRAAAPCRDHPLNSCLQARSAVRAARGMWGMPTTLPRRCGKHRWGASRGRTAAPCGRQLYAWHSLRSPSGACHAPLRRCPPCTYGSFLASGHCLHAGGAGNRPGGRHGGGLPASLPVQAPAVGDARRRRHPAAPAVPPKPHGGEWSGGGSALGAAQPLGAV